MPLNLNLHCFEGLNLSFKRKRKDKNLLRDDLNETFIEHPNKNYQPLNLHNNSSISEMYLHSHTMSYVFVKSDKLKLIGKSEKKIINLHPSQTLPPNIYIVLEKIYKTAKKTHQHSQNKYFYMGKSQLLDAFPLVDKNKEFIGLLIIQRELDNTELI